MSVMNQNDRVVLERVLSAAARLWLFARRELELSEEDFDTAMDLVVELLEEVNNEKFRVTPRGE